MKIKEEQIKQEIKEEPEPHVEPSTYIKAEPKLVTDSIKIKTESISSPNISKKIERSPAIKSVNLQSISAIVVTELTPLYKSSKFVNKVNEYIYYFSLKKFIKLILIKKGNFQTLGKENVTFYPWKKIKR